MSERIESMLEKVLENSIEQGKQLVIMETKMDNITSRGCKPGEKMVEATRLEAKGDTKGAHKRIDNFKIGAYILTAIAAIFGLVGYE